MENPFKRWAAGREAKKQIRREENVSAYFQSIYKNIFKSGTGWPRVSWFMDQFLDVYTLQNKVLVSRAIKDLSLPDDQGRLIVTQDNSLTRADWLFKADFKPNQLVIRLNPNFPVPEVKDTDLTHYEERDVYETADILFHCGYYLEQAGDKLMTRAEFKQSIGQV